MENYWGANMSKEPWFNKFGQSCVLTGNVAKVKVLHTLYDRIAIGSGIEVLDIGCVGPKPLEFWEPFLPHHGLRFHLTGIDVDGIEKTREIAAQQGWNPPVRLCQGSGYDLENLFKANSFDIVVATQVLEHVARIIPFMRQLGTVLKTGGEAFFTFDSGHWQPRFDIQDPMRLAKNIVKKGLGSLGDERHYDLPWLDREIVAACNEVGLEVVDCRFYNLPPLKWIHNHLMPAEKKNAFMRLWFELEEFINDDAGVRDKVKNCFLVIYLRVRKGSTRSTSLSGGRGDAASQTRLVAS